MNYRGFEIKKRPHFLTGKKTTSVKYGAGTSKTTGYFNSSKTAKLFIDWIIASDYSRNANEIHGKAFWRYQDAIKAGI